MKKTVILLIFCAFVITTKAQNAQQILKQADSLRNEQKYSEAITLLEKNIEINKNNTDDLIIPLLREDPKKYANKFSNTISAFANTCSKIGDYQKAISLRKENIELIEKHKEYFNNYANVLAGQYGSLSFNYLFTKDFELSELTTYKALEIDSTQTWVKTDMEDGILTADEISRLNLTKTKLVVLSACETCLGDVKNSEGVFGLQRAFKLAGVESLIMSLWKVPDDATAELMTTFYDQWLSRQTKQNAFKAAQQKVRERYESQGSICDDGLV